ncbi:MAG: hypothetical protein IJV29_16135 [Butyrivibrio sp.]|nr:hypothetical protein [Butyrivibrio sp.]
MLIIISVVWSAVLDSVEYTAKVVEIFDGKAQIVYTVNEQEKTAVITVPDKILNGVDQFGCPLIEKDSYIKIQDWFGHVNVYSWETGRSRFHGSKRSYWSTGRYLVEYGWIFGLALLIMGNPYNWRNLNFGQRKNKI